MTNIILSYKYTDFEINNKKTFNVEVMKISWWDFKFIINWEIIHVKFKVGIVPAYVITHRRLQQT